MTNLVDLVPSLQRTVAVPGTFATIFPDTGDPDLALTLADGLAEAQLDGWFVNYELTVATTTVTPDLSTPEQALVILYAAARMLAAEIRNRKTHRRYEASGAVFEEDQSATMLVEQLRELNARKAELREQARLAGSASAFLMADLYLAKAIGGPWPVMADGSW